MIDRRQGEQIIDKTTMHTRLHQSGNVLFLILITVALFAALAYAVSQSARSGNSDVSAEKMELTFHEIQNAVNAHRMAITRMVAGGVPVFTLDARSGTKYTAQNSNCASDACRVYHPQGGGLLWYDFEQLHPNLSATKSGGISSGPRLTWVAWQGTEARDIVYLIPITESFCNFINEKLQIHTPTTSMVETTIGVYAISNNDLNSSTHPWSSSFTRSGQAAHLNGKMEGCYKTNSGHISGPFIYYAFVYAI